MFPRHGRNVKDLLLSRIRETHLVEHDVTKTVRITLKKFTLTSAAAEMSEFSMWKKNCMKQAFRQAAAGGLSEKPVKGSRI